LDPVSPLRRGFTLHVHSPSGFTIHKSISQ
jgi:hypothetical protein